MQKKSASSSGFIHPRVILLWAAAACLTVPLLWFVRAQGQPNESPRTLSFEERVSYQKAIEDVYWRHRIWPNERKDPKPSLDSMMSQAQIEKKIADYLRSSQALEDYWQRPITAEQLQAEMDRMAKHTRQPEVLSELFEALGNDPFVIAECLARPALAERLVRNWYAYDQRIHGALKQRADAELRRHPSVEQMKRLSGKYSEIEYVKNDKTRDDVHHGSEHGVSLTANEWAEALQKLTSTFAHDHPVAGDITPAQIKAGVLSPLQEDEERFYAIAVTQKTKGALKLATVSWPKEPLESWLSAFESQIPNTIGACDANYVLPVTADGGNCTDDTWTPTAGAPDTRYTQTAVWTGSEMIVWGGSNSYTFFNTGGRYSPATDTWTATSVTNAPDGRFGHTAVWTGTDMIIWGGYVWYDLQIDFNTGGKYNPANNSWTATSTINAPTARHGHTAVWSGSEMIVWGGGADSSGGRYNPDSDSWTATSVVNAPMDRFGHTTVWTGNEMIIWGGYSFQVGGYLNTGGRYNPSTNSWTATSINNPPSARSGHSAVWTGAEMIVWGGSSDVDTYNTGGRYNPVTDTWIATSAINTPTARSEHTAVWTGSEMLIWGGYNSAIGYTAVGGRYNPIADNWSQTNTTNAPDGRIAHTAVWSGTDMIIWGGYVWDGVSTHAFNTGGKYNPTADSWTPTSTANAPVGRYRHTGIWTGSEMIVWGGFFFDGSAHYLNTGGKYNLATDTWSATSTSSVPSGRYYHTAVWTGNEMIVWGGYAGSSIYLNSGGKYNPAADSWTATNTANAPTGRQFHTAVWAGSEMIVWGGYFYDGNDNWLDTGGRYTPINDSWSATSTTNAPTGRDLHTAIWTESNMIVWGGYFYDGNDHFLDTGAKYDPSTNSWTPVSTINAPTGRDAAKSVWTGNEMIVWGGYGNAGYLNTGRKYSPASNSWNNISTTNVPSARAGHSGVWTGNEMIVWGGYFYDGSDHFFNTGGRYNPNTNEWTVTDRLNAPAARTVHTAVWTGNEMIIWGGQLFVNTSTSTGGIYCAQSGPTPTPSPTLTPTPCVGRCGPTPRPRPSPHVRPSP